MTDEDSSRSSLLQPAFGLSRHRASILAALMLPILGAPLFALSDWRAGIEVPLTQDFAVLARVLLVMPLLIAAAPQFDMLIDRAMEQPMRAGLLSPRMLQRHRDWSARLRALRGNRAINIVLVLMAVGSCLWQPILPGPLLGLTGWGFGADGRLNAAGGWYVFLFMPLFRFLILMWLWRLLLWTVLLGSLARLNLRLNAAHPDGAGGLGYLGFVQQRLSVLLVAGALMLAGSAANRIRHLGETMSDNLYPLVGYVLVYPLLLLAPLLLLTPLLLRAKRDAVLAYGVLGQQMAHAFHKGWIQQPDAPDAQLLSPAPSAMADFGAVHATVAGMGLLPIRLNGILVMLLSAGAPLALLLFVQLPFDLLLRSALAEIPPFDLVAAATP